MKVLIACGASGGHIFPGLALGASLNEKVKGARILYVCSNRYLDRRIFVREGLGFKCLSSNKLPLKLSFEYLAFLVKLSFDMVRSLFIILNFSPDVIMGFGGYASFPVVIIGKALRVPIVVHEQNVRPGRANAFLFGLADRIAVSFKETFSLMPDHARRKAVLTGNPIRTNLLKYDRAKALEEFKFNSDKFTILVVGGSQGANRLNRVFVESVTALQEERRRAIQIVHIAGDRDRDWVEAIYDNFNVSSRVFSFIDRIDRAYSIADLVFTRSGAAALFELAFYAKPMVLVPYPYAMNHQKENALVFSERGAAICKDEKELAPKELKSLISELMDDKAKLEAMSRSSKALSVPDAAARLADTVIEVSVKL